MAVVKLNPPLIDGVIVAQKGDTLRIPFQMNRSVAKGDVAKMKAIIKSVQTNAPIATVSCNVDQWYYKNNQWIASFPINQSDFLIGQYYKVQLAYVNMDNENDNDGFYSSVGTFKYTSQPSLIIKDLEGGIKINTNIYNYTGVYENALDPSEKVYSYWFNVFELGKDTPVQTSGELLHNSSTDEYSNKSQDTWTTRYGCDGDFTIQYCVKTINGLVEESQKYRITDNQAVDTDILKYYQFVARNDAAGAYVELSIEPRSTTKPEDRKFINGQFLLLRSSSADNYQSWYQLTEFILANWDSQSRRYLCRDYCVSQGVSYKYALQAFNAAGIYSKRIETDILDVDFEDMYLSDGKRQLRIRYNPKVSSFKNTILESKMDTIGGKYPFFFRNGNVKYKEFPISGLISALTDENNEFIQGLQTVEPSRVNTPFTNVEEYHGDLTSSYSDLSADNFRKEREFKIEVLEWLTNGKPKLFRSPGEGSFIVRLMNTSMAPNDTLSRMLHTFTSTAYEIADCTFENLRAYGMLMEEKLETRDLEFIQRNLTEDIPNSQMGVWRGNAVMATIVGEPNIRFYYQLQNDSIREADLGVTGIYEFDKYMLADNPLVFLQPRSQTSAAWGGAVLTYAQYAEASIEPFSIIENVTVEDKIDTWIGRNRDEIAIHLDKGRTEQIRESIGNVYYLKVQERPIVTVFSVEKSTGGKYIFWDGSNEYHPTADVIVKCNNNYYDGRTKTLIGQTLDYNLDISNNEKHDGNLIAGQYSSIKTAGRMILTNLADIKYMYLGNALYADIVYQLNTRYYTFETGNILQWRQEWEADPENLTLFNQYYNALISAYNESIERVSLNAL